MNSKTLVKSEYEFKKIFLNQFKNQDDGLSAWKIVDKPESFPCVVVKSCGLYFFVYPNDFI